MTISKGTISQMKILFQEEWDKLKGFTKEELIAVVIAQRQESQLLSVSVQTMNGARQDLSAAYMQGRKSVGGVTV